MAVCYSLQYSLQKYQRSNQDTCLVQRPAIFEGDWVQVGDLLADSSASAGGELSLGQNILIAYMPWEGYNYEDAILISERLVYDDVYTSIHIERYEIETRMTKYGREQITNQIPDIPKKELSQLDQEGIIKMGSWVKEGDILVGKVTPIQKKFQSPYQKLLYTILEKELQSTRDSSLRTPKGLKAKVIDIQIFQKKNLSKTQIKGPHCVHLYLAEKRKIKVGDKMAGRHGNKGIVSQILPREDMPYLPDGTPIDMVLNPLGVPSRMNVGQIYECLLGLAAKQLGEQFKITPFDEIYGAEASRSLTFSKLYEAKLKTGKNWLFNPNHPGKMVIFDGRTGEPFDQPVTVGIAYMLKLVHLVDDKIHCLTPDHDVLTERGWVPISQVQFMDKVATLNNQQQLTYTYPIHIWHYSNYRGNLYHISNPQIHLNVTPNHRMWVCPINIKQEDWSGYNFLEARQLVGKQVKYLKLANWVQSDFQFYLPNSEGLLPMDEWLKFFGLWIAEAWVFPMRSLHHYGLVQFSKINSIRSNKLTLTLNALGFKYRIQKKKIIISHLPLYQYLKSLTFSTFNNTGVSTNTPLPVGLAKVKTKVSNLKIPFSGFSSVLKSSNLTKLNQGLYSSRVFTPIEKRMLFPIGIDKFNCIHASKTNSVYKPHVQSSKMVGFHQENKNTVDDVGVKHPRHPQKLTDSRNCKKNTQLIQNSVIDSYYPQLHGLFNQKQAIVFSQDKSFNQTLPTWVWQCSQRQCRVLLEHLVLEKDFIQKSFHHFYTTSSKLADDMMRLALHAGWSADVYLHYRLGSLVVERTIKTQYPPFCVKINKTENCPVVNDGSQSLQKEHLFFYKGPVHCLEVPSGVFMVRNKGKAVWTGNSRSTGPYSLVTQQPLRGRSKYGGQRLGEMEVWALEGYGAAFTLLEMLTIKSDDITGRMTLWSNIILHNEIYIGTPESFKVLVCELQALCLDIGLFRIETKGLLRQVEHLMKLP